VACENYCCNIYSRGGGDDDEGAFWHQARRAISHASCTLSPRYYMWQNNCESKRCGKLAFAAAATANGSWCDFCFFLTDFILQQSRKNVMNSLLGLAEFAVLLRKWSKKLIRPIIHGLSRRDVGSGGLHKKSRRARVCICKEGDC
jgi:hypothetical protein